MYTGILTFSSQAASSSLNTNYAGIFRDRNASRFAKYSLNREMPYLKTNEGDNMQKEPVSKQNTTSLNVFNLNILTTYLTKTQ